MGKVFVHKPLKRSELRRLSEEPKPIEASPEPIVARLEPVHDPEKDKRAAARAIERAAQRQWAERIGSFANKVELVVAGPFQYVRWLLESLHGSEKDIRSFSDECNLMAMMDDTEAACLVCGGGAPRTHRGMAILPSLYHDTDPGLAIVSMLCRSCDGWKPRLYMSLIVRMVMTEEPSGKNLNRMRKVELGAQDLNFLEWLKYPPSGDDRKAIAKHMDSGRFDNILNRVSRLIPDDESGRPFGPTSVRHQGTACLNCGKVLDGATAVAHRGRPTVGSISVCIDCGYVQAYGRDMQFRELTGAERIATRDDARIKAVKNAVAALQARKA